MRVPVGVALPGLTLAAIGLVACDPDEPSTAASEGVGAAKKAPSSDTPTEPSDSDSDGGEPQSRFDPPDPDNPLAMRVHELNEDLGHATVAVSPMYTGQLEHEGRRNYQAVLKPGYCYRVVATGSDGVQDLDLLLFDASGVPVQQDPGTDANPVLGMSEPICPERAGLFRVQVKMFEGSGKFAMRIYRTQ